MHAAFVADEIWGFMLEPARTYVSLRVRIENRDLCPNKCGVIGSPKTGELRRVVERKFALVWLCMLPDMHATNEAKVRHVTSQRSYPLSTHAPRVKVSLTKYDPTMNVSKVPSKRGLTLSPSRIATTVNRAYLEGRMIYVSSKQRDRDVCRRRCRRGSSQPTLTLECQLVGDSIPHLLKEFLLYKNLIS